MANWKSVLEEKGFTYDPVNEYYKISTGFGRTIVVDQIMKGLFRMTKNDTIYYDNFISSFDEFKKKVDEILVL